jgi:hypothetical protein
LIKIINKNQKDEAITQVEYHNIFKDSTQMFPKESIIQVINLSDEMTSVSHFAFGIIKNNFGYQLPSTSMKINDKNN